MIMARLFFILFAFFVLNACSSRSSDSANGLIARMEQYYQDDQFEKAIPLLGELIRLNPETAEYYSKRGVCYMELLDFKK